MSSEGVRRSSRVRKPAEYYVHPDHAKLLWKDLEKDGLSRKEVESILNEPSDEKEPTTTEEDYVQPDSESESESEADSESEAEPESESK